MNLSVQIMCITKAATMPDMEFTKINGEDGIRFPEMSEEYKYLTALPIADGDFIPMCSKDKKEWAICLGAEYEGIKIDLPSFVRMVKAYSQKEERRRERNEH